MENADIVVNLAKLRARVGSLDRPLIDLVIARLADLQKITAILHQNNRDLYQENFALQNEIKRRLP